MEVEKIPAIPGPGSVLLDDGTWLEPQAGGTVARLRAHLAARHGDLAALFAAPDLKIAVNQRYAAPDTRVRPGDEVALFPPVTGG